MALSSGGAADTEEGDKELEDQGIAAMFRTGAGAGDIALYLKRLFNEDHEPDDDDIAVLAGLLSSEMDESDGDDDTGAEAAQIAALKAEGYNEGYEEAYAEAYEEGYVDGVAKESDAEVVHAEVVTEEFKTFLQQKVQDKMKGKVEETEQVEEPEAAAKAAREQRVEQQEAVSAVRV